MMRNLAQWFTSCWSKEPPDGRFALGGTTVYIVCVLDELPRANALLFHPRAGAFLTDS